MALAKEVHGSGIRSKTPRPVIKYILKSPYRLQWPSVSQEHNDIILRELKREFVTTFAPRQSGSRTPSSLQAQITEHCLVGINAITRALEKERLPLVLTPACAVEDLSKSISTILRLRSVLAIAFKNERPDDQFQNLICLLTDKAPELKLPWESKEQAAQRATDVPPTASVAMKNDDGEREDAEQQDDSTELSCDPNDTKLYELNVKRKVFLPKNRKRKHKE